MLLREACELCVVERGRCVATLEKCRLHSCARCLANCCSNEGHVLRVFRMLWYPNEIGIDATEDTKIETDVEENKTMEKQGLLAGPPHRRPGPDLLTDVPGAMMPGNLSGASRTPNTCLEAVYGCCTSSAQNAVWGPQSSRRATQQLSGGQSVNLACAVGTVAKRRKYKPKMETTILNLGRYVTSHTALSLGLDL